jgi:hypothetical protein
VPPRLIAVPGLTEIIHHDGDDADATNDDVTKDDNDNNKKNKGLVRAHYVLQTFVVQLRPDDDDAAVAAAAAAAARCSGKDVQWVRVESIENPNRINRYETGVGAALNEAVCAALEKAVHPELPVTTPPRLSALRTTPHLKALIEHAHAQLAVKAW